MDLSRMEALIGEDSVKKLNKSHVAVFGLGGVGSYVTEALARAGVGTITLVDHDVIASSNINRQLYALTSTMGKNKVDVAKERILQINPKACVYAYNARYDKETEAQGIFDFCQFDYVVDAIDTVTSKLLLVKSCNGARTPIISCMGTGNKLDATAFEVADISKTSVCPLAKVMRRELKKLGITTLKVVYSTEQPITPDFDDDAVESQRRQTPASVSFVPPVAGFILAGEVIKDLIK